MQRASSEAAKENNEKRKRVKLATAPSFAFAGVTGPRVKEVHIVACIPESSKNAYAERRFSDDASYFEDRLFDEMCKDMYFEIMEHHVDAFSDVHIWCLVERAYKGYTQIQPHNNADEEKKEMDAEKQQRIVYVHQVVMPLSSIWNACAQLSIAPIPKRLDNFYNDTATAWKQFFAQIHGIDCNTNEVHIVYKQVIADTAAAAAAAASNTAVDNNGALLSFSIPTQTIRADKQLEKLYKAQIRLEAFGKDDIRAFFQTARKPIRCTKMCQVSSYTMFVLNRLLSNFETSKLIQFAEKNGGPQGFQQEYNQQYRDGSRVLFKSELLAETMWNRIKPLITARDIENNRPSGFGTQGTWTPTGVNTIFRIAKYEEPASRTASILSANSKSAADAAFQAITKGCALATTQAHEAALDAANASIAVTTKDGTVATRENAVAAAEKVVNKLNAAAEKVAIARVLYQNAIKTAEDAAKATKKYVDSLNENKRKSEAGKKEEGHGQGFVRHIDAGFCLSNENRSIWSVVVYLNEVEDGGETQFWANPKAPNVVTHRIQPTLGSAVFFNHNIPHQGNKVTKGIKYILRMDVMFSLVVAIPPSVAENVRQDVRYYKTRFLYRKTVEAALANKPDESTASFLQALDVLKFSRHSTLLDEDMQSIRRTWGTLDDNTLFKLLSEFVDAQTVLNLAACSRFFARRCNNSELWKLCYARRWPSVACWEMMHLSPDAVNPALVSYKHIFQAQLERSLPTQSCASLYIHFGRRHIRIMCDAGVKDKPTAYLELPNIGVVTELDMQDYWGYHIESHQVDIQQSSIFMTAMQNRMDDLDWLMQEEMFQARNNEDADKGSWKTPIKSDWTLVCIGELFKYISAWNPDVSASMSRIVVSCSRPYSHQFTSMLERACAIQAKSCFSTHGRISIHFVDCAIAIATNILATGEHRLSRKKDMIAATISPGSSSHAPLPAVLVIRSGFRTSSVEIVYNNKIVALTLVPDCGSILYFVEKENVAAMKDILSAEDISPKQPGLYTVARSILEEANNGCESIEKKHDGKWDVEKPSPIITGEIISHIRLAVHITIDKFKYINDSAISSVHVVLTGGNMLVGDLSNLLSTRISTHEAVTSLCGIGCDVHMHHDRDLRMVLHGARICASL